VLTARHMITMFCDTKGHEGEEHILCIYPGSWGHAYDHTQGDIACKEHRYPADPSECFKVNFTCTSRYVFSSYSYS